MSLNDPSTSREEPDDASLESVVPGSQSLLLQLPVELRVLIWEFVVGAGGTIHICRVEGRRHLRIKSSGQAIFENSVERLHYKMCPSNKSFLAKDKGADEWAAADDKCKYVYRTCGGEGDCWNHYENRWQKPGSPSDEIDLTFLFTCRQVYLDARDIVFKRMVFSFACLRAMGNFVRILSRNQFQLEPMRNVQLNVGWRDESKVASERISELVKNLSGLRRLHFCSPPVMESEKRNRWYRKQNARLGNLIKFRALELETVTFDLPDERPNAEIEVFLQKLLDPKGDELEKQSANLAAEQEKAKREARREGAQRRREGQREEQRQADLQSATQP